jgi:hypothetical protein
MHPCLGILIGIILTFQNLSIVFLTYKPYYFHIPHEIIYVKFLEGLAP